MFYSDLGSLQSRVARARQAEDLYFATLLPKETVNEAFGKASGILDRARVYVTSVTVWVFLSQVLSKDHGCVAAVAKLIVYRVACGLAACCAKTGAYCIARDKLDEQAMHRLLTHTGQTIEEQAPDHWQWLGHRVMTGIDACIEENDVFLADRAYAGWFDMARLIARGAHVVVRKHHLRKSDFRTGRRLGHDDHIIRLEKPQRPKWMSQDEYQDYPALLEIREVRIRVQQKGFRTREIIVHTSLLDDVEYSQEDIAALFRRRWQAELHLRSLKTVMQMEHLRCKKPHRVRNEVRTHMIAYNLIRQVMSEAASRAGVQPWQISFKATMTTLMEALPVLGMIRDPADLCCVLLACCQQHRVGDRPDRYEPRVVKRRPKPYKLMQKPRRDYKPGEA